MTRLDKARAASLARRQTQTANARPGVLAPSIVAPSGFTGRRTRASMTGAQRNSQGRRSEWTLTQNNRDGRDRKWDATVSRG